MVKKFVKQQSSEENKNEFEKSEDDDEEDLSTHDEFKMINMGDVGGS
jgi:hypothetical protein